MPKYSALRTYICTYYLIIRFKKHSAHIVVVNRTFFPAQFKKRALQKKWPIRSTPPLIRPCVVFSAPNLDIHPPIMSSIFFSQIRADIIVTMLKEPVHFFIKQRIACHFGIDRSASYLRTPFCTLSVKWVHFKWVHNVNCQCTLFISISIFF